MSGGGRLLVIQSDWHDSLRDNNSSVWIYHKRLGETGQYGKIGGATCDESFQVVSRSERTISVKHQPTGLSTVFIAPVGIFSGIHSKSVVSLDVSGGGLGVSVCTENKLHVWESETGIVRRTLEGHLFDVYTCRLFSSGLVVLSGGGDMQLRIWDAVTGRCAVVLKGHTGAVLDTAIINKGKNIISVSKDGTAKLWNCGQGKCIATLLSAESVINCCALTDVTGIINLPAPAEVTDDQDQCSSGKVLLVGCEEGSAHLLGVESREVLASFSLGAPILSACWATRALGVLGLGDGRLVLVDVTNCTTCPLAHDSASPVESLSGYCEGYSEGRGGGVLAGRRDGVCQFYWTDGLSNELSASPCQLTGSDCDPVYRIATNKNHIYTASRDGCVRKYRKKDLTV